MSFPWIRLAVASLALSGALAGAPAVASWEGSMGYVDEIDNEETFTAHATWLSAHPHPWEITGGYLAARDDVSPELSPGTFYVSVARRYVHRSGFFFAGGVALTSTDGDDEVLSGPLQFVNGIGWQGERIVVAFRHISNGSFRGRNRGENLLTIGWRF